MHRHVVWRENFTQHLPLNVGEGEVAPVLETRLKDERQVLEGTLVRSPLTGWGVGTLGDQCGRGSRQLEMLNL